MPDEDLVKLPVRLRSVVSEDGLSIAALVRCPRQNSSIDAARCTACTRKRSLTWDEKTGGSVVCAPGVAVARPIGDARTDFSEAAARCQLHELVEPVTFCVRPGTRLSKARRLLLDRGLRAVPVVDDELRLVGILSRTDLVDAPPTALVRDVMPARVHALPEDAPIGYAIALMASENVHEVPVVTEDGEVLGLFHACDALRWTAERMGYVMKPSA